MLQGGGKMWWHDKRKGKGKKKQGPAVQWDHTSSPAAMHSKRSNVTPANRISGGESKKGEKIKVWKGWSSKKKGGHEGEVRAPRGWRGKARRGRTGLRPQKIEVQDTVQRCNELKKEDKGTEQTARRAESRSQ